MCLTSNVLPPTPASARTWALPALAWFAGVVIFFRQAVFSGIDTITGDEGDARLLTFLHEHWWQVWRGERAWRTPPMFHPAKDVLSYSDTFVLDQLVYTPLRAMGVDPFAAYQLTLIALTGVGFAAVFTILRRHLRLHIWEATTLAWVVVFANNLYVDTGHGQMYATNVIPVVLLLGIEAWCAVSTQRQVVFGAVSGLLLGLLLWSTFYLGWFAIVIGGIAIVTVAMLQLAQRNFGAWCRSVIDRWAAWCAGALGFGVAMVPFFATYLPALRESRERPYEEVKHLAPRPFDVVNVGVDNVLWGRLLESLGTDDQRLVQLHRAVAVTPILLMSAAFAGCALALRWRRGRIDTVGTAGITASLTTIAVIVLPVQFGFGGAWAWFYRFVPGGDAIRVYGRIEVVNGLLAALAVACWLSAGRGDTTADLILDGPHHRPSRHASAWTAVLLAVIVVEQLNTTDNFRRLDREQQLAWLDAVPEPPSTCDSFDIEPLAGRDPDHTSIDAILIAQRFGLPTVNGYSGWQPDGWNLRPDSAEYPSHVAAWVEGHELTGECTFVAATQTWRSGT